MKITFDLDMENEEDRRLHQILVQAERMVYFIDTFKSVFRCINKYESFPNEIYPGMIHSNLTGNEKKLQAKLYKHAQEQAEQEYQEAVAIATKEGRDIETVHKRSVSNAFRLVDNTGKCTISGFTLSEILRDYFFHLASEENINMEL